MEKPTTIDEYIAGFPAETQKILQQLREELQKWFLMRNRKSAMRYLRLR